MKRLIICCFLAIGCIISSYAQIFRVGNLKFNIVVPAHKIGDAGMVEATGATTNGSGELVIPEAVQYNGETYVVVSIARNAFAGGRGYTSLKLPSTLNTIEKGAFFGWENSKGSLVIPNSVKTIGEEAFERCSGFTSLTLPNKLKVIEPRAFRECSGLSGNLIIPNSVIQIGNNAFEGCSGITSLTLGNKIETIGKQAFWRGNLKGELIIPNSVKIIGPQAFEKSKITSLKLSELLQNIGYSAFYDCSSLTGELIIPSNVKTIGEQAFNSTSITGITFESSPEIYQFAFRFCRRLKEIKCYTSEPPKSGGKYGLSNIFEGCPRFPVGVPQGCLKAYRSSMWGGLDIFDDLPPLSTPKNITDN